MVLVVVAAHVIPIPVRMTVSAYEVTLDGGSIDTEREIRLSGFYHLNLFRSDTFSGTIAVSGYEFSQLKLLFPVGVDTSSEDAMTVRDAEGRQIIGGHFYSGRFLRHIIIGISEHPDEDMESSSFSTEDGTCVVSGFSSPEKALEWAQQVIQES